MKPRLICGSIPLVLAALAILPGCSQSNPNANKNPASLARPVKTVPAVPPAKPEPLNRALRTRAWEQVKASSASKDPYVRAHVIEACRQSLVAEGVPLILSGINDQASIVAFSSLVAAGELRLRDAYLPALNQYNTTQSKQVRLAAIFCLHRLGDTRFSHAFETTANDADRTLRANTALLLGMLGEPSAKKVLEYLARDTDPVIRLQAAEGLWRLRQRSALETLVTATISRYADDQIIAALALAAPRDPSIAGHLRGMLTTAYPEVNLAAARALGQLGIDDGYGIALEAAQSKDPRQRQLAAMAFGAIGRSDSQSTLGTLLNDREEDVRLAAATAILQLKK